MNDDAINFKLEITNPDLAPLVNKLVYPPVSVLQGDILKLDYNLKHDYVINEKTIDGIATIVEILKDPDVTVDCQYKELLEFRSTISKLNTVLEQLEIEISAKAADGSNTKTALIERLSQPYHQPTRAEEAFVEAVLKAT
jgi:hypothetical protein